MTPPRNPFSFGRVVQGQTFCDRQADLRELRRAAATGRSLWLYAPRRHGKTSLLLEAFADSDLPFAYVDLYATRDREGLAEAWLRGITPLVRNVLGPGERALRWLREAASNVAPQVALDSAGKLVLTLGARPGALETAHVMEIVDLPQRLAVDHGVQVAVALDEFQEIVRAEHLAAAVRTALQHHDRVTYFFSGSRRSLLADLFTDRDHPFYQFAEHHPLVPIPARELERYVRGRFESSGVSVPERLAAEVVEAAGAHPHYTQMLAARIWDRAWPDTPDDDAVDRALDDLARSQDLANRRWFESLSAAARRVALHVARHGGARLLSQKVRLHSRLGPASTVQNALARLEEREDLLRDDEGIYRFDDPILARWLRDLSQRHAPER